MWILQEFSYYTQFLLNASYNPHNFGFFLENWFTITCGVCVNHYHFPLEIEIVCLKAIHSLLWVYCLNKRYAFILQVVHDKNLRIIRHYPRITNINKIKNICNININNTNYISSILKINIISILILIIMCITLVKKILIIY